MQLNQLFNLSGKTELITGCLRQIGKAIIIRLVEAGTDIIGISSTLQPGSDVDREVKKSGRKFLAYTIDPGNRNELYESIAKIKPSHPV
jgi:2-deoxy-D-gluconate 3-dehydrogenase